MSSFLVAVRLARREVLRRPGRTILVALLVALPVAGMAAAAVIIRSDNVTLDDEWQQYSGQAEARLQRPTPAVLETDPTTQPPALPAGSRSVVVESAYATIRTADRTFRSAGIEVIHLPLGDPLVEGMRTLVDGRAPKVAGEAALSRSLARKLHAHLGQDLALADPPGNVRVVGLVESPSCLSCDIYVAPPGTLPSEVIPDSTWELIDLPALTDDQLAALDASPVVELRSTYGDDAASDDDGGDVGVRWSLVIGAVALTVMGIVISAAFAVGARRQLVVLGQLSATGASPAVVRRMLLLQGTITGIVGSLAGAGLGLGSLLVFQTRFEEAVGRRVPHLPIRTLDVASAVVVGVLAATIAALLPARTAAGIPTLSALAGRRPQPAVPARLVAFGFLSVAAGLALLGLAVLGSANGRSGDVWALVAIVGGVAELLGACAIAPAIVARLEPLAGRLHGSWRLAARSLARSRTRTGAVVSAVAAAGALAVLSTALATGADARDDDYVKIADNTVSVSRQTTTNLPDGSSASHREPVSPQLLADLERILPAATHSTVRTAVLPADASLPTGGQAAWFIDVPQRDGSTFNQSTDELVVADPATVRAYGLDAAGRRKLADLGVVALSHSAAKDTTLQLPDGSSIPAGVVEARHSLAVTYADVLVTEELAQRMRLDISSNIDLYTAPKALTAEQRDAVDDARIDGRSDDLDSYVWVAFYSPSTGISAFEIQLILSGVALLFAMFVVGASLALAAAESKDERDVLTVAGAAPRALARSAGTKAFLLAGIGGVMAVPVGFLPVLVYVKAESTNFPAIFPYATVLLLLVAVPALVGLASMATSATAQRLRPVRVSTAVFD